MPSFVLGANELVTQAKDATNGTNGLLLGPLLGNSNPIAMSFSTVHVNDIADAHVNALKPEVEGNQAFVLSSDLDGLQWDDAISITRRNFPEIEQKGILPLNGTQPSLPVPVDTTKARTILGIKFKSYEEQVNIVVGHYLTLVGGK
jgi:nucleoside-diphosphate-sugar epimerase